MWPLVAIRVCACFPNSCLGAVMPYLTREDVIGLNRWAKRKTQGRQRSGVTASVDEHRRETGCLVLLPRPKSSVPMWLAGGEISGFSCGQIGGYAKKREKTNNNKTKRYVSKFLCVRGACWAVCRILVPQPGLNPGPRQ